MVNIKNKIKYKKLFIWSKTVFNKAKHITFYSLKGAQLLL